ncbi:hypothetical protein [Nostoc sp. FACHB-190]|uniref:hypothetical protein n=1 Tax=Nostoc sp. FACHB-190 TaxID=2692838 RepID=UPI00168523AC|nr:hypothetical protein [Nostoc sp. FACHB-190]
MAIAVENTSLNLGDRFYFYPLLNLIDSIINLEAGTLKARMYRYSGISVMVLLVGEYLTDSL